MVKEVEAVNIATALITLVMFIATIVFAAIGFVGSNYGIGVLLTCLAVILGYFVWVDYNKYIRKE